MIHSSPGLLKKQHVVSRSIIESEYSTLALAATKLTWVQSLLQELKIPLPTCPLIWYDNMSASSLAANPDCHARTKHLEIDLHFVRDKVLQQDLKVRFMPSCDQLADCLTKTLVAARHQYLRSKLGVTQTPFRLRGAVRDDDDACCSIVN